GTTRLGLDVGGFFEGFFGLAVGKFDADEFPDLAVGLTVDSGGQALVGIKLFRGGGDGTFQLATTNLRPDQPLLRLFPHIVRAADLNHDGRLDLVTANFNRPNITVWLGNGDGSFASPTDFPIDLSGLTRMNPITLGDLNGDNAPEIVMTLGDDFTP